MTHLVTDFKTTFRRRVLLTNEVFGAARPRVLSSGSVVGIGTTMLWHFASLVRPQQLIAVDRSYSVYIQNRVNAALLARCKDERELRERWISRPGFEPGKTTVVGAYDRALLAETLALLPFADERDRAIASELLWRHAYLGTELTYSGPTLADTLRDPTHPWRNHDGFLALQTLAREGRITLHHADVRDAACLAAIAEQCATAPLAALYFSNVAPYVLPDAVLGERLAAIPRTNDAEAWIAVIGESSVEASFVLEPLPLPGFLERCQPRRARDLESQWRSFDASAVFPEELQRELLFEALADHAGGLTDERLARVRGLGLSEGEWLRVAALTRRRELAPAGDEGPLRDWLRAAPSVELVRRALRDPELQLEAVTLATAEHLAELRAIDHESARRRRLNLGDDPGGPVTYLPGDEPERWPNAALERLFGSGADASDGMWPEAVIAAARGRTLSVPAQVRVFFERLEDPRDAESRLVALREYDGAARDVALADADALALRLGAFD